MIGLAYCYERCIFEISSIYYTPTDLCVLVAGVHSIVALLLGDDFTRVLNDDLVGFKGTVGSYAIASVIRLRHFDTDIVFLFCIVFSTFASFLQIGESAICAVFRANVAIMVITFVKHESVETLISTAVSYGAIAHRVLLWLCLSPISGGIADENIC